MGFSHREIRKYDGNTADAWHGYVCGHCRAAASGFVVGRMAHPDGEVLWLLCPTCGEGTTITSIGQPHPGQPVGVDIEGLPAEVDEAYEEARRCLSVAAYTACELLCRKILMHVAVDKGDKSGRKFVQYIDYLADAGYVTPPMQPWVKLIKDHGNDATHDLPSPTNERAEGTLTFTAELLRMVYEMEHMTKLYAPADDEPPAAS